MPVMDHGELAAALAAARSRGAAWAEAFVEVRERRSVRTDGKHHDLRADVQTGASIRVERDGLIAMASTSDPSPEGLLEAAQAAASLLGEAVSAARVRIDPHRADALPEALRLPPATVTPIATSAEEMLQAALSTADAARDTDRRVRQVAVTLMDVSQQVLIASTDGLLVHDLRTRRRLTCRASARSGDRSGTAWEGPGAAGGATVEVDPVRTGRTAARSAVALLGAVELRGGEMPVVLGPGGGGLLIHEACGHGLEGDAIVHGSSVFGETRDGRVAPDHVSIRDDPTLPGAFGSYAVDDEGRPAACTTLVDAGVQVAMLTDRITCRDSGSPVTPSANGRRESAAHLPGCRMSNTFLAAGTADPGDIVSDVRRGVYIERFSGGDVDTATGDFAFVAGAARMIENGQLTHPVAGVTVLGNGPSTLAAIEDVGHDLTFTASLCGKADQWVPVSFGSPTFRVRRLQVTGASGA